MPIPNAMIFSWVDFLNTPINNKIRAVRSDIALIKIRNMNIKDSNMVVRLCTKPIYIFHT